MSLHRVAVAVVVGAVLMNSASIAGPNAAATPSADANGLGEASSLGANGLSANSLSANNLSEIVVTAQRREESARTVGIALSVVSGQGLAELAVRHPQRINALILVDAAGFPNEKPPGEVPLAFKILRYPIGRAILRNIDNRPLIDEGLRTDVYDKTLITPAFVDRRAEFQRAPGHRAILMSLNPSAFAHASVAALNEIKVPTLILHGENDVLIDPASARKFAAAIPGSKLVMYRDVGHLPQIEIPQRSAADVAEFLRAR